MRKRKRNIVRWVLDRSSDVVDWAIERTWLVLSIYAIVFALVSYGIYHSINQGPSPEFTNRQYLHAILVIQVATLIFGRK